MISTLGNIVLLGIWGQTAGYVLPPSFLPSFRLFSSFDASLSPSLSPSLHSIPLFPPFFLRPPPKNKTPHSLLPLPPSLPPSLPPQTLAPGPPLLLRCGRGAFSPPPRRVAGLERSFFAFAALGLLPSLATCFVEGWGRRRREGGREGGRKRREGGGGGGLMAGMPSSTTHMSSSRRS